MTRETKIGLLVGLAFIIVIGILLSDHLTATNEPQQAALAQAGGNVRSAVTTPGAGTTPVATNTQTPHVTPQQPVPTKEELTPKQAPVEIVQIGGSSAPQHPHTSSANNEHTQLAQANDNHQPDDLSAQQGVAGTDSNSVPTPRSTDNKASGGLAKVAESMGEEIIPAGGQTDQSQDQSKQTLNNNTTTLAGAGQYKAEPGDNLAKIALKTMKSSSKANIKAIIAANPSLQQNPNLVIAGTTYVIPGGASATATQSQPTQSAPAPTPTQVADNTKPADTGYTYTVKAGDSLTRIAVTQLGTPGAVEAIKDLNKDQLKGGDVIHPNMKLRLPAKPLASAS